MTFILKEVYDYIVVKTNDDTPLHGIRKLSKRVHTLKEKINELNVLLNN
jgi:hypothetical protein